MTIRFGKMIVDASTSLLVLFTFEHVPDGKSVAWFRCLKKILPSGINRGLCCTCCLARAQELSAVTLVASPSPSALWMVCGHFFNPSIPSWCGDWREHGQVCIFSLGPVLLLVYLVYLKMYPMCTFIPPPALMKTWGLCTFFLRNLINFWNGWEGKSNMTHL